jgi:hypothetical protein
MGDAFCLRRSYDPRCLKQLRRTGVKEATRRILGAAAIGVSGALLALNSASTPYADIEDASGGQHQEVMASVARFTGTPNYCKAFLGIQEHGADGVTAAYSVALVDLIHANADNVERTLSLIRATCSGMA